MDNIENSPHSDYRNQMSFGNDNVNYSQNNSPINANIENSDAIPYMNNVVSHATNMVTAMTNSNSNYNPAVTIPYTSNVSHYTNMVTQRPNLNSNYNRVNIPIRNEMQNIQIGKGLINIKLF